MKVTKLVASKLSLVALTFGIATVSLAQSMPAVTGQNQTPTDIPVARGNNLRCAGYITTQPISDKYEIVGGEQEQEQRTYTQGNVIYINAGKDQNVAVGDRFSVTRPRGTFRSPFSSKGQLGVYVEELGEVRVTEVKQNVAVAVVDYSCETMLLGDLLEPATERVAPTGRPETVLDRFVDPTGKATGRIVLARDGQETLSRDNVVFIDLGSEDNVKAGDYLTIYRPLGGGSITKKNQTEIAKAKDYGFESKEFRGGKFSNQAPRQKGADANGGIVTTPDVKKRRPQNLRKVVGEVVVLKVQQRTATAIITRTAQEIHTGDFVELQ